MIITKEPLFPLKLPMEQKCPSLIYTKQSPNRNSECRHRHFLGLYPCGYVLTWSTTCVVFLLCSFDGLKCDKHADFLSFSHFVQPLFHPSMLASDPCWADDREEQHLNLPRFLSPRTWSQFESVMASQVCAEQLRGLIFVALAVGSFIACTPRLLLRNTRWGLILLSHGLSPFFGCCWNH